MADSQFSGDPSPDHPMANPGYGKRSAPDQRPRTGADFTHLVPRDAAIASYIDALPDGADISVKTLAKTLPYGQCAVRTSLNRLQEAGHLRRGSDCVASGEQLVWVTRTFFSRTARDHTWWTAFARGDAPTEPERSTRSRAFILLAALGRTAPALSLAQRDCVALEPSMSEWLRRGATPPEILNALTTGLPDRIHHPAAFVANRLRTKLPPAREAAPRTVLRTLECSECRVPGPPEALLGGKCAPCRGARPRTRAAAPALPPHKVRAQARAARAGLIPKADRPGR
ncbi:MULTISPECIES: hypothetical protein [unclassified Streptomyces]|uniref:hypothetical protein n=1 Tax=unclassified Streptomyces TaxID=2593676 RepID=UPI000DAF41B7|nr:MULTISPECIES: hypothetical protein [unclassified Streptomyces]PZT75712.1 hypothetical protein DNK56_19940 [Streptomyces sp. AC1-42W]PZT80335.1 hypothetical protein DNK55_12745 [Streptomyces sp. AC1-42T]